MPRPKMESECGQPIANESQAIDHATECCSVGRVKTKVTCGSCGQPLPPKES